MDETAQIEAKIMSLTSRQCQILYWICRRQGIQVKELARVYHVSHQTIHFDIGHIYEVFGLTSIKDVHEKRRLLEEKVGPVHLKLIANPDFDCEEKIFQKGDPPPPDSETMRIVKIDLERGFFSNPAVEDALRGSAEEAQMRNNRGMRVIDQDDRRRRGNRLVWVLISMLGAILVALVVLILLVVQLLNQNNTSTALGTPGQVPATGAPQPPGGQQGTSIATIAVVVPTQLPPPPSTTPTPRCEPFHFTDDFEGGLAPEWKQIGGQSIIVNGRLGSATDQLILEIGDHLCDYTVDLDYKEEGQVCGPDHLALIFGGILGYATDPCDHRWQTRQNGKWVEVSLEQGIPRSGHLRLRVKGADYTATIDGNHELRINYGSPQHGPLRVTILDAMKIDNFSLSTE